MSVDFDVRGQQGINLFTGGRTIMWIMDIYGLILDYGILARNPDGFVYLIIILFLKKNTQLFTYVK